MLNNEYTNLYDNYDMSNSPIRSGLKYILDNYEKLRENIVDNKIDNNAEKEIKSFIRTKFLKDIVIPTFKDFNLEKDYLGKGSTHQGKFPTTPYLVIKHETNPEKGQPRVSKDYYIAYLFCSDLKGLYLTLSIAGNELKNFDVPAFKEELYNLCCQKINPEKFSTNLVDLHCNFDRKNYTCEPAEAFQKGTIFSKYYSYDENFDLPSEKELISDLREYMELYDDALNKCDFNKFIGDTKEMTHSNDFRIKNFKPDIKRNKIFFGAPGTGKSFELNSCKDKLLKNFEDNYERVTFHPDYTYANFVGTYKPVQDMDENNNPIILYKYVPGPFMRSLVNALKKPYEPFVLIIEEINRANVAAVFGDIFQLLDRENNVSRYPINASKDMKDYLEEQLDTFGLSNEMKCILKKHWISLLGEDYLQIKIPANMFIWATMNSADQGVFPMDTAFKRRWDFKYFDIHHGEPEMENIKVKLNYKEFLWNDIRNAINDELISYGINEDKLMGPFFAFTNYIDKEIPKDEFVEIDYDDFKETFKNKIIMYLFEDVARSRRLDLFKGTLNRQKNKDNITYYQICNDFEENGLKIFSKKIRDELDIGE